jgi:pilus assembly protein CpaF
MSFELILPYLRPIENLVLDDEISEVMVNASGRVFIERLGELAEVPDVAVDAKYLNIAVKNIARLLDDDISEEKPILDARLPDGSRVAAMLAPYSVGGTTLTIRKFGKRQFSLDDLVSAGCLDVVIAEKLLGAIAGKKNCLISGGTGAGKTTLLNALLSAVPDHERIILIEDTAEIQLCKPNLVRFEARRASAELPEVPIRDLIKASLRHRPDRIIVGEVRGGEAFDLLQALNTGHAGSISTIHANSCLQALTRLAHCVVQSGIGIPYASLRGQIGESLDLMVQVERRQGKRLVTEVVKVGGFDYQKDEFDLHTLYRWTPALGGSDDLRPGSLPPQRVLSSGGKSLPDSNFRHSA